MSKAKKKRSQYNTDYIKYKNWKAKDVTCFQNLPQKYIVQFCQLYRKKTMMDFVEYHQLLNLQHQETERLNFSDRKTSNHLLCSINQRQMDPKNSFKQ